jgi:hypothetical protein
MEAGDRSEASVWGAHADVRELAADEREETADQREQMADDRDSIADERDLVADRREGLLDNRERAAVGERNSLTSESRWPTIGTPRQTIARLPSSKGSRWRRCASASQMSGLSRSKTKDKGA